MYVIYYIHSYINKYESSNMIMSVNMIAIATEYNRMYYDWLQYHMLSFNTM